MKDTLQEWIDFASKKVPLAMEANKMEILSHKGTVAIKGARLYAVAGGPVLAQVLIGKKWITIVRGPYPSDGMNFQITANGIRSRARKAGKPEKAD